MTIDFADAMPVVAEALLGKPVKALSRGNEWRYGKQGSMEIRVDKGVWHNHETDAKGGVLDLIDVEKGLKGREAIEWLRSIGVEVGESPAPRTNGHANGHAHDLGAAATPRATAERKGAGKREIVETYPFRDVDGAVIYEEVRFQTKLPSGQWETENGKATKTIRQRRPDPDKSGEWLWNLDGVAHTLYDLPEIREEMFSAPSERRTIFIPEGPRKCEALKAWGLLATSNSGGAANWRPDHAASFAGADVVLLLDNDEAGRKRGEKLAASLTVAKARVRLLDFKDWSPGFPAKGDIIDWRDQAGGTAARLYEIIDKLKPWAPEPFVGRFGGKFIHEFMGEAPARDWLLKGVFLARTLFLIIGQPGCGKSFLALDMIMTMALAAVDPRAPREWFGRKIKPCGVTYIAAEGQEDFIIRMHAWFAAKGLPVNTKVPVYLVPTAIDMRSSDDSTKVLIEDIKKVSKIAEDEFGVPMGLVVVDTLNRALAGGDDTKPDHIGAFIRNCSLIREMTGVATCAVHHTPHGKDRARGHGSVSGDNDAEVFVKDAADGAPNEWQVTRSKASARGDRHEFRLRQAEVGRDADMEAITSCYVAAGAYETSIEALEMRDAALTATTKKAHMTADGRSLLGPNLTVAMRALHEAIERIGEIPIGEVRVPHGRKAIKFSTWTDEIVRSMPGDDKESAKFKDKCRKARDAAATALRNRGIIGMDGDWVWRTSKRVAMVDKPENSIYGGRSSDDGPDNSEREQFSSELEF